MSAMTSRTSSQCWVEGRRLWETDLTKVLDNMLDEKLAVMSSLLRAEFEKMSAENDLMVEEIRSLHGHGPSPLAGSSLSKVASEHYSGCGPRYLSAIDYGQDESAEACLVEASSFAEHGVSTKHEDAMNEAFSFMQKSRAQRETGDLLVGDQYVSHGSEEQYENVVELTRAFHNMCRRNRTGINARELVEMAANQQGVHPLHANVADLGVNFRQAIQTLNEVLGIKSDTEISLDTFLALMQRRKEFGAFVDKDVLAISTQMREILLREDAFRRVAQATSLSTGEITQGRRAPQVASRMESVLHYMDPIIGFVITLNAIIICISTDIERNSDVWKYFEGSFTVVFVSELLVKLLVQGPTEFFMGKDLYWNIFDTIVVVIAGIDVVLTMFGNLLTLRNFTLIRMLRFARLTKLVRVLKLKLFKELALMINGLFAGMRTLLWSMVFLGFLLFALGVLLTQLVGHEEAQFWTTFCDGEEEAAVRVRCRASAENLGTYNKELFGNVFRSAFTVFRCFTDGCTSIDGSPLIPHFHNTYGFLVVVCYMVVMLFVLFGLFNLIMAIFVENTIDNAKHEDNKRREARHVEHLRVARKLQEVIVMLCSGVPTEQETAKPKRADWRKQMLRNYERFRNIFATRAGDGSEESEDEERVVPLASTADLSINITPQVFSQALERPEVQKLLGELGIDLDSKQSLFQILDANGNGMLEVSELVQGFLKLRSTGDNVDSIASLLAIRSVQKSIRALEVLVLSQTRAVQHLTGLTAQRSSQGACKLRSSQGACKPQQKDSVWKQVFQSGVVLRRAEL